MYVNVWGLIDPSMTLTLMTWPEMPIVKQYLLMYVRRAYIHA